MAAVGIVSGDAGRIDPCDARSLVPCQNCKVPPAPGLEGAQTGRCCAICKETGQRCNRQAILNDTRKLFGHCEAHRIQCDKARERYKTACEVDPMLLAIHNDAMKLTGTDTSLVAVELAANGPDFRARFMAYYSFLDACIDGRILYRETCAVGCDDPGHDKQIRNLQNWRRSLSPLVAESKALVAVLDKRSSPAAGAGGKALKPILPAPVVQTYSEIHDKAQAERKAQEERKAQAQAERAAAKQAQKQKEARQEKDAAKKKVKEEEQLIEKMAKLGLAEKEKTRDLVEIVQESRMYAFINGLPGQAQIPYESILRDGPLHTFLPTGRAVVAVEGPGKFEPGYYELMTNFPKRFYVQIVLSSGEITRQSFAEGAAISKVTYDLFDDQAGNLFTYQYFEFNKLPKKKRDFIENYKGEHIDIIFDISQTNKFYVCAVAEYLRENKYQPPICELSKSAAVKKWLTKLRDSPLAKAASVFVGAWLRHHIPRLLNYFQDRKIVEELLLFFVLKNIYVNIVFIENLTV